jgi:hypothetical protein
MHIGKVILVSKYGVIVVYWESGGKRPRVLDAKLYTDMLERRLDELKSCRNVITKRCSLPVPAIETSSYLLSFLQRMELSPHTHQPCGALPLPIPPLYTAIHLRTLLDSTPAHACILSTDTRFEI